MSKKVLHIFNDKTEYFVSKSLSFIERADSLDNNIILNYHILPKEKQNENVIYSDFNSFIKKNNDLEIKTVVFHCFYYYNIYKIKKIKKVFTNQNIKFVWSFWSHEYYQLPHNLSKLYTGLSRRFLLRKVLSFHYLHFRYFLQKKVPFPFYLGAKHLKRNLNQIDLFCSFIEGDFNEVYSGENKPLRQQFAYITSESFKNTPLDKNLNSNSIMVGHSGSPILNHYEILKYLEKIEVTNKIILPLSYGKQSYIKLLKSKLKSIKNLNINLIEKYLPENEYFHLLDEVGIFILNAKCQQALGNVIFFLWNGSKVFLSEESSTYKTYKKHSFHIYSIEKDLNQDSLVPLTLEQRIHNRKLIAEFIEPDAVIQQWKKMIE